MLVLVVVDLTLRRPRIPPSSPVRHGAPCSWLGGTSEVMCQAFTYPWVGFSPRLPYLQRSGDHDDRKHKGGNTRPNYKKEPAVPSEHHPHSGRIMGDLSLPLVMPPGTVIWPLKRSLWGCFHRWNSQFFWSAGLVTARGFCVILGVRHRPHHRPAPGTNRNGDTSTPWTITLCGLP